MKKNIKFAELAATLILLVTFTLTTFAKDSNKAGGGGDATQASEAIRQSDDQSAVEQVLAAGREAKEAKQRQLARVQAHKEFRAHASQALGVYRLLNALGIDFKDEVISQMPPQKLDHTLFLFLLKEPDDSMSVSIKPIYVNGREVTFNSTGPTAGRPAEIEVNWPKFNREVDQALFPVGYSPSATHAGLLTTIIHEGFVMSGLETSFDYSHSGKVGQILQRMFGYDTAQEMADSMHVVVKTKFDTTEKMQNFCSEFVDSISPKVFTWYELEANALMHRWDKTFKVWPFLDFIIETNAECVTLEAQSFSAELLRTHALVDTTVFHEYLQLLEKRAVERETQLKMFKTQLPANYDMTAAVYIDHLAVSSEKLRAVLRKYLLCGPHREPCE